MTVPSRRARLDLNTADPADLAQLPGLTAELAGLVVAHRPFAKTKELLRVPGISLTLFETLEPLVRASRVKASAPARPARKKAETAPKTKNARAKAAPPPAPSRARRAHALLVQRLAWLDNRPLRPHPNRLALVNAQLPPPRAAEARFREADPAILARERLRVVEHPEAIIISEVQRPERALAPLTPTALVVARVERALFESYLGPRVIFALFSFTVLAVLVGVFSGQLRWGAPPASPAPVMVVSATAPDLAQTTAALVTQVSVAVQATSLALALTPTAPPPSATPALATPTAEPTATPLPTETAPPPPPTPTSVLDTVGAPLFIEDFSAPNRWIVGETSLGLVFISGQALTVRTQSPGNVVWSLSRYRAENLYVQATLRFGRCQPSDYGGLIVRARADADVYLIGLTCDGRYRVLRLVDGRVVEILADFTPAPGVATGANASNQMGAKVQGGRIELFFNGQYAATVEGINPREGLVGVFNRSGATPGLQTEFTNIAAWSLP